MPTQAELTALRELVADTVTNGSQAEVKAVLQALVEAIRVDSRHAIQPIFRVPTLGESESLGEPPGESPEEAGGGEAVRAPSRLVGAMVCAFRT